MQRRARELAELAIEQGQAWVSRLNISPSNPAERERWIEAVSTIAAYRDRWNIDNDYRPLGSNRAAKTIEAGSHRKLAKAAVERALRITFEAGAERAEVRSADAGPSTARGMDM